MGVFWLAQERKRQGDTQPKIMTSPVRETEARKTQLWGKIGVKARGELP